jgi:hypothetical protein
MPANNAKNSFSNNLDVKSAKPMDQDTLIAMFITHVIVPYVIQFGVWAFESFFGIKSDNESHIDLSSVSKLDINFDDVATSPLVNTVSSDSVDVN